MADPVTLSAVGTGASVGGGLLSAFSQIFGGEAESSKFKYQAGMAKLNANINRQNRDMAIHTGDRIAQQSGMKTAATIGAIRAGQGASGTDVGSGSNVEVAESQHAVGKADQETIRWNAAKRAYGFEVKALEDDLSAGMFESAAQKAKASSGIMAIGSLVGTAGSVADKWLKAKYYGMGSEPSGYEEDNKWV